MSKKLTFEFEDHGGMCGGFFVARVTTVRALPWPYSCTVKAYTGKRVPASLAWSATWRWRSSDEASGMPSKEMSARLTAALELWSTGDPSRSLIRTAKGEAT